MDYTNDISKLKINKSELNLSISYIPGELSAIFDIPISQPKLNCKV
jgi:hypothetical protein